MSLPNDWMPFSRDYYYRLAVWRALARCASFGPLDGALRSSNGSIMHTLTAQQLRAFLGREVHSPFDFRWPMLGTWRLMRWLRRVGEYRTATGAIYRYNLYRDHYELVFEARKPENRSSGMLFGT